MCEFYLNQTIGIENLEIILVDDKSTDNTVERLKQYEVAYPEQIMLILCEKNGRQGTARNIGMSYATGEYISFVDSDDWIRKDMYEILTTLIEETNADIVQFDFKPGEEGELDIPLETVEYNCYDFSDEDQKRGYLLSSEIYNESCTRKIYKRELENKIICNIANMKICGLRKAMDIYYSSNVPGKIEKEMGDVRELDVQALTKEAMKRKREFLR